MTTTTERCQQLMVTCLLCQGQGKVVGKTVAERDGVRVACPCCFGRGAIDVERELAGLGLDVPASLDEARLVLSLVVAYSCVLHLVWCQARSMVLSGNDAIENAVRELNRIARRSEDASG